MPILISPPSNLTALDGKDATITCTAEGAPAPNITWFFNGEPSFLLFVFDLTLMRRRAAELFWSNPDLRGRIASDCYGPINGRGALQLHA